LSVKVFGLSASPRKGKNTEYILKEALKGAEEVGDVETELLTLCDKKIEPCIGCLRCHEELQVKGSICQPINDDFEDVAWKLAEGDGIIIGCPVYQGATTPLLEAFFSRFECFGSNLEKNLEFLMPFRNKVGGAVSTGALRSGGQEYVFQRIYYFFMFQQMLPVGMMEGYCMRVSSLQGGACIDFYPPGFEETPITPPGVKKTETEKPKVATVEYDKVGLETCRLIGRRVAIVSKHVKPWADREREEYRKWFMDYNQDYGVKYRHWHATKEWTT